MLWNELNKLSDEWQSTLFPELNHIKSHINRLETLLAQNAGKFHPNIADTFKPFHLVKPCAIRVVIVGQDPYPKKELATGLPFSTPSGKKAKSATNIFNAITKDIGGNPPNDGNLEHWPPQGIFLLNRKFTIHTQLEDRETRLAEEIGCEWKTFSATLIEILSQKKDNLVFLLWGKPAQRVASVICDEKGHCVLKASHPSVWRKNQNCKHFSKTNDFLLNTTKTQPICWLKT